MVIKKKAIKGLFFIDRIFASNTLDANSTKGVFCSKKGGGQ